MEVRKERQQVYASPVAPPGAMGIPRTVTFADRISRVGCTQLIGKHGFETQLTNTTSANFSGQMVSRNGLGGGNLVGTLKTHWSPRLFSEVTLSFLRPQIITTKGQYTVDANSFSPGNLLCRPRCCHLRLILRMVNGCRPSRRLRGSHRYVRERTTLVRGEERYRAV